MERSPERLRALAKMADLERQGIFDRDVEEDPPGQTILPGTVDYRQRRLANRIKAHFAFRAARQFVRRLLRRRQLVVRAIHGVENLDRLASGAVLTCNHFNAFDSFAMQLAYEASRQSKKRKLFRVIREGNYTSFPGFYGRLMRHCNTLPLSSNLATMKEFLDGVHHHLANGHYVLVYPEQSMWWNYRKPKPLKLGAFQMARQAAVPVVPIFIAMEDAERLDGDGFPIQAYTIFIGEPIYPDMMANPMLDKRRMAAANYAAWKAVYERFYGQALVYDCDPQPQPTD